MAKKYYYIVCAAAFCFIMVQCGIEKEVQRDLKTALSNIPGEMTTANKEELSATYHRGFHLYKATCSGCHGASSRGLDTIPHFTFAQLDNYKESAAKGDQDNHAVAKKLSQEQLGDIMSFLFLRTVAKQADLKGEDKK